MSSDAQREADQKKDARDSIGRRPEIDQRTRMNAEKLSAKEPRAADATRTKGAPDSLPKLSSPEYLQRLDRISERSSLRHLPDFDPAREQHLEDFEIRTGPVGFLQRQDHAGLDRGTVKLVRHSLEAHGINGPDDLHEHGLNDTWEIWDRKTE